MSKLFSAGQTYLRLGGKSLFSVALYRLKLKSGLLRRKLPPGRARSCQLFISSVSSKQSKKTCSQSTVLAEAHNLLEGYVKFFSDKQYQLGSPPDWFFDPVAKKNYPIPQEHWSALGDFTSGDGDIKCIWEASRFDWILIFARAYSLTSDLRFLTAINYWASDWTFKNPSNTGPNWKCGQEVSIRMMQVLLAAYLLGQHEEPSLDLIQFVLDHASRIEPTIRYAIAQNNNHGTSEAAALFIAGSWLHRVAGDASSSQAQRWKQVGREWLENRVAKLVADDGSFSQYSVNYHRVLLDTLCLAEFWRDLLGEPPFSNDFSRKAKAATKWLYYFTNEQTGDAPNIGANDGARLFNLSSADYRDYRPTVQLASRLFYGKPAYSPGDYDEPLMWLDIEPNESGGFAGPLTKEPTIFQQGGYCYLAQGDIEIFVRFPRFRFRPGHADALHLDLWFKGGDIIRDGGTYSYNTDEPWQTYFPGTRAHSTVEFDDRDQMPRLSRFLFGRWIKTRSLSPIHIDAGKLMWSAGYKDYRGAEHNRKISLSRGRVLITDTVRGFKKRAVTRWRLEPGDWQLDGHRCSSAKCTFAVSANVPVKRFEIIEGYESRYYLSKTPLPVLEVEVDSSAVISTEIVFVE